MRTMIIGFVAVLVNLFVTGIVLLTAIDNLEQTILDSNKATEPAVIIIKEDCDCKCTVEE